ncbi:hypothetical protein [Streptomyces sp. NPDC012888]|uniref:hypothetical protein n=1 Tax=Streptomyces sp. NPDC012888 TaxID=3364855 RepID=UPI00369A4212
MEPEPSDVFAVLAALEAEQERLFDGARRVFVGHAQQFGESEVSVERGLVLAPVGGGTPEGPFRPGQPAAADWLPGMQVRLSNHCEAVTVVRTVDEFGMDAHLTVTRAGYITSTLVWAQLDLPRGDRPAGYHVLGETTREAATAPEALAALRAEIDDLLAIDNPFEAVGPPVSDADGYSY